MSFLGAPLEIGLSALFENKPDVPQFHWTDLLQQQLDTTQGNLDVLPSAEKLGAGVNDFMRGERAKTLAGIPGLGDIESETAANLKSWLRGELSPDMASQISRAANARAFGGGYGGGGPVAGTAPTMKSNLTARDFGIGSQQLQQMAVPMGQQYAMNAYNMRRTPEFDPSSMFINPMAAAHFNNMQNQQQYQRDWLANRIAAQPEPWQQTMMTDVGQFGSMLDSIAMQYAGGMSLGPFGKIGAAGSGQLPYAPQQSSPYMITPPPANEGFDSSGGGMGSLGALAMFA